MFLFHLFLLGYFFGYFKWIERFDDGNCRNFSAAYSFLEMVLGNQEPFRERWAAKERAMALG